LIAPPQRRGFFVEQQLTLQLFELCWVSGCVAKSVLNVAVPDIVLNEFGVCALVGEGKAAGKFQVERPAQHLAGCFHAPSEWAVE
jgi:hypothetical protein